jgi:hypothetical protein
LALVPSYLYKKVGEQYVVSLGGMLPVSVYFAFNDNRVFITDDADAIAKFLEKGFDKQISSSSIGNDLKNYPILHYINLDLDTYPESVKLSLQSMGRQFKEVMAYLNIYKDFKYGMKDQYSGEAVLKMKNGNVNALKQILKNVDENTSGLFK